MKKLEEFIKFIEKDLNNVKATVYESVHNGGYNFKLECGITGACISHTFDFYMAEDEDFLVHMWKRDKTDILIKRGEHYSKFHSTTVSHIPSYSYSPITSASGTGTPGWTTPTTTISPSSTTTHPYTWYTTAPTASPITSAAYPYVDKINTEIRPNTIEVKQEKVKSAAKGEEYRKVKNYGLF